MKKGKVTPNGGEMLNNIETCGEILNDIETSGTESITCQRLFKMESSSGRNTLTITLCRRKQINNGGRLMNFIIHHILIMVLFGLQKSSSIASLKNHRETPLLMLSCK
jgi:hypothetical protein